MKFNAVTFSNAFQKERYKKRVVHDDYSYTMPSLRYIAKSIGVSASTLSRVQNGGTPDIDSFGKICEWVGRSTEDFFDCIKK